MFFLAGKRTFSDEEIDDNGFADDDIEIINADMDAEDTETEDTETEDEVNTKHNTGKPHSRKWLPVLLFFIIAAVCILLYLFIPSNKKVALTDYYGTGDNEAAIIYDHTVTEHKGIVVDGHYYIPADVVKELFTDKLYEDRDTDMVLYAKADTVWQIPYNNTYIKEGEENIESGYVIILKNADGVYVCADFLNDEFGYVYKAFEAPYRIAFESPDVQYLKAAFKDSPKIRTKSSIKGHIIGNGGDGTDWFSTGKTDNGWMEIVSCDGRQGYVKKDAVTTESYISPSIREFEYKSQVRNHKIVLAWDAIYDLKDNDSIPARLENVKNANVISPTWYKVKNNTGELESMADVGYVAYVHNLGYEVWPLVSDFGMKEEIDEGSILSSYESRRALITNIMNEIKLYGYDGINIDFEKIKADYSGDYIQFIRELSVECRRAEVVLSVDNYPPYNFNRYYNRKAQGECVDYVVVMCYDEHYNGGEKAGSTSSLKYLVNGMNGTLEEVDKKKVIVAVPFYTRLWQIDASSEWNYDGTETSGTIVSSTACSMEKAQEIIKEYNLNVSWNENTEQEFAEGTVGGYIYQIWLETAASLEIKLDEIIQADIGGVAAWELGFEQSEVWNLFKKFNS